MKQRHTPLSLAFIGHAVPIVSGAMLVVVLLLYSRSQGNVADEFDIRGVGSANLKFQSSEGKLIFGVFEEGQQRRWWQRRRLSFADLNMRPDDYFGVVIDPWGWGIAIPHLGVMAALLIPVAWWFLVFVHRDEHTRRVERGLCVNCGYDLTYSKHRCPECGEAHSNLKWNEIGNDPAVPLPPPPLT